MAAATAWLIQPRGMSDTTKLPPLVPPRGMTDTNLANGRIPAIRRQFLLDIPTTINPMANRTAYNRHGPSPQSNGIRYDVDRHLLKNSAVRFGDHVSSTSGKLGQR